MDCTYLEAELDMDWETPIHQFLLSEKEMYLKRRLLKQGMQRYVMPC